MILILAIVYLFAPTVLIQFLCVLLLIGLQFGVFIIKGYSIQGVFFVFLYFPVTLFIYFFAKKLFSYEGKYIFKKSVTVKEYLLSLFFILSTVLMCSIFFKEKENLLVYAHYPDVKEDISRVILHYPLGFLLVLIMLLLVGVTVAVLFYENKKAGDRI